ncbi:MAG TPA: hypothetical protein VFX84_03050 [Candidatus Saccharimonadales bacterium]|nr:hypothetical protein [Candidatus Saccharimonadales bacterium]
MLEKLLAALPYDPGLGHKVAFYSRRMREEASIRRTGMIFVVLAFMVQFFAVLSPPKTTSASEYNNMLSNGFSSAQDAAVKCHNNVRNFKTILNYYGIYCGKLKDGHVVQLGANSHDGKLYSMGHSPYGQRNPTTNRVTNESAVNIPGAGTLYVRLLRSFGDTTYNALRVTSNTGKAYWLLFDCGNLVSVHKPVPEPVQENTGIGPAEPVSQPKPQPQPAPTPATPAPAPAPTPTPTSTPAPCPYDGSITADNPSCKPCDDSANSTDAAACITVHKAAANVTAGLEDANGTTADPGDVITYTLYAKNNGKAEVPGYSFQENLDDVLVYASITDLHGGTMDGNHTVTWPAVDIAVGDTRSVQATVKVKDPVPQNPRGQDDPNHFDLTMTNVYGNAVNIKVPGGSQKQVEAAAATLPNAGPGTSLLAGGAVVMIAGYFYGRARLLSKESELALQESHAG